MNAPWASSNLGDLRGAMVRAENKAAEKIIQKGGSVDDELGAMLGSLRLDYLRAKLDENEVDVDSLKLMSEEDLREMGIAKGPRVKLMKRVQSELFGLSVGAGRGSREETTVSESGTSESSF